MSFNSKQSTSDQQMKEAFAQNPVRQHNAADLVASLNINTKPTSERKQSVSITMTPTMKEELTALAKQNGYTGLSSFAVEIFQAILDQQSKD
ncbi:MULTISPECIES: hypothetical protein [Weissella]|jgi:hypothetical protein|uniref:Uncharacterized protein n=2 Tax=Weissella TaxID=46255 RepID=A0A0D1K8W1_9LACO|nr:MULTISPECIES: hypothetical protein [Weissella]MBU7568929.1 hypothetical protein [Weissella hellenica]KIU21489.1 hypothetical protein ab3b_01965 [Weissella cibaria]MBU7557542.1 hypothetical protein [Weissella paramesenteroides]MCM6765574.1 hypothetical protein [Weissella paramesenteroides]MCM6766945.1 hypothetical protein [Weissella paramesenteroides]